MELFLLGAGYAHPDVEIDNQLIEDLNVGTTAQWITEKIGIEKRRSSLPLDYVINERNEDPRRALEVAHTSPTQLGVDASKMALERAGVSASDIGLVICNCCTPKTAVPPEAVRIARGLEIDATAYDVFTACPAFALHIDFLDNFADDTLPDYVLCVSTATLTQRVDYNDRSDGAIWGDGAAAWVMSRSKLGRLKVLSSDYMSDPTRSQAVVVDSYGYFHQDGRAIRDFSVRQTVRLLRAIEDKFDIDWNKDIFIGHQANATMLRQITKNRKIPDSNHWHNVTYVGNQAGAGAPASLAMHWDDLHDSQRIVVAVVGAGLSWGSVVLEVQ